MIKKLLTPFCHGYHWFSHYRSIIQCRN